MLKSVAVTDGSNNTEIDEQLEEISMTRLDEGDNNERHTEAENDIESDGVWSRFCFSIICLCFFYISSCALLFLISFLFFV